MTITEAKEAVAFKYFREKWNTLANHEKVAHYDEVAELYAESKAENLSICTCEYDCDNCGAKKVKPICMGSTCCPECMC